MPYSPFQKIKIVTKEQITGFDVRTRAMLFYLQHNESGWQELSKPARLKYKKLMGERVEESYIDVDRIFKESYKELGAAANSWRNFERKDHML